MDPMDVMVLVSLVKPGGSRWPLEAAIVTRLGQLRGGGWCWAGQAAEWTGASEVKCRRALRSLEERKIVKRDPGDSGRDHIRWCAVNEDWRRWRVEWAIEPSQIAAQLALAAQQRDESPFVRIFARSYSARSVARIARSFDARSWVEDLEEVAGIARQSTARSSAVDNPDRAMRIARSLGRRRAVLERAILGVGPQQLPSAGGSTTVTTPPAADGAQPDQQQRIADLHGGWVKSKLLARSLPAPGRRVAFLNGPPLRRLADMIEAHGAAPVAAAVDLVPDGELSALFYVDALADEIDRRTAQGRTLAEDLTATGHLTPPVDPAEAAAYAADFAAAGANLDELKVAAQTHPLDRLDAWHNDHHQEEVTA